MVTLSIGLPFQLDLTLNDFTLTYFSLDFFRVCFVKLDSIGIVNHAQFKCILAYYYNFDLI